MNKKLDNMDVALIIKEIFEVKKLAVSIAAYLKIAESADAKIDKLISKEYESAVNIIKQVQYISSKSIYNNMLINAVDRFNQAIVLEKHERKLYSYLGLMMCFYYLNEKKAFFSIQQTVAKLEFEKSFWDKNGAMIIGVGQVVIGIAAAFTGGGSAASRALIGTAGQNSKQQESSVKEREKRYNALRDEIARLKICFIS